MSYMAVGSRQILFADAQAPASAGDSPREVANLVDNRSSQASSPADPTVSESFSSGGGVVGSNVDVLA